MAIAEGFTLFLIFGLLPPAVLIAAIAAIIEARHQSAVEEATGDPGIGTVRRLFIYALALVSLIFAATGIAMIIAGALEAIAGRVLISDRRDTLSVALAFVSVGTPAWLFFAMLAQRSMRDHPVESRSQARRLYLGVARVIAVALITANAVTAGRMVAGLQPFAGSPWGYLTAWIAVWSLHTRVAASEPAETTITRLLERFTAYFGAALGLFLLLGGASAVLRAPVAEAYDRAFRETLVRSDWTEPLSSGAVILLVGAALWGWHWVRQLARRDRLTTLWRTQVFIFGALLGVTLALVPSSLVLYATLEWFLGKPGADSAATQFSLVPSAAATCIIGLASWGYHRAVLTEAGAAGEYSGPERVYRYVLSGAGLVTVALGVATLIALAADAMGSAGLEFVRGPGWWRNPLVRALSLLLVGVPLWLRYWFGSQREVQGGRDDRAAPSRRVYLFLAVGVAVLALLISLTALLYRMFRATLSNEITLALLRDSRWAVAVVATSAVVAAYHFLVMREDQEALATAAPPPRRARDVLLVSTEANRDLARALADLDGVRVRSWRRVDAPGRPLTPELREGLLRAVAGAEQARLLVIVGEDTYELVPYEAG
ncbi:MAG: hypothetical protein EPO16_00290 [Dehalococcoidia bacterium]|nr:MAG: hypothetical protein EPO16_00290 [Dehalococcoidia bacterium]